MHSGLHVKYPLFLSDFSETCIFSLDFRKKTQQVHETRPDEAGMFHSDGRKDMTNLTVAFRSFAN